MKKSRDIDPERKQMSDNPLEFGCWNISIQPTKRVGYKPPTWRNVWQGRVECEVFLEKSSLPSYSIGMAECSSLYSKTKPIDKWWTHHKTPAIFRKVVPVIYKDQRIVYEFLTGKGFDKASQSEQTESLLVIFNHKSGYK